MSSKILLVTLCLVVVLGATSDLPMCTPRQSGVCANVPVNICENYMNPIASPDVGLGAFCASVNNACVDGDPCCIVPPCPDPVPTPGPTFPPTTPTTAQPSSSGPTTASLTASPTASPTAKPGEASIPTWAFVVGGVVVGMIVAGCLCWCRQKRNDREYEALLGV